jgi:DNA end-binding protein Ku
MARGIWTGSLSFGLVNVPVELVTAVRDRRIRLREVHATKLVPVQRKRICTLEDVEVPNEEIAHGLPLDGQCVMLTDEELTAVQPETTKTIEISGFVHEGEIDPVFYDRSYWLVPKGTEEGPVRAYHLLASAMGKGEHVALGTLVIHSREHPVAIRAREGRLLLSTMLFSHEVRSLGDLELPDQAAARTEVVEGAVAIVGELAADFHPTRYHDRNRKRLQAIIDRKSKGEQIEPPPAPAAPKAAPDLMGALERSLEEVRKRTGTAPKRPSRASKQASTDGKQPSKDGKRAGRSRAKTRASK